jgi:PAS domain S-box-containing protein
MTKNNLDSKIETTFSKLQYLTKSLNEKDREIVVLNKFYEEALEGISFLDINGKYLRANQSYCDINSCELGYLIGKDWKDTVFKDDIGIAVECYEDMKKNGKSKAVIRGVRKNGEIYPKYIKLVAYVHNNEFLGHYCFMEDTTNIKNVEGKQQYLKVSL